VHYVPRPGGRWVRLGEQEWRLLRGMQGTTRDDAVAIAPPGWSPDDVAAAIDRFTQLGLLGDLRLAAGRRSPPRVSGIALAGCAVIGILAVEVVTIDRLVPWEAWALGRPAGWLAALVLACMAAAHEAGHAVVATAVGYPRTALRVAVGRLGWIPLPTVRLERFWAGSKTARTAVVLAGSGAQLVIATVAGGVWVAWYFLSTRPPASLLWAMASAIMLAAVNLLPVYPLDGYWFAAVRLDRPRLREESPLFRIVSAAGLIGLSALLLLWIVSLFL
jgi:Zn-dependent protease